MADNHDEMCWHSAPTRPTADIDIKNKTWETLQSCQKGFKPWRKPSPTAQFHRNPCCCGAGTKGSRFDHWEALSTDAPFEKIEATTVSRMLVVQVPKNNGADAAQQPREWYSQKTDGEEVRDFGCEEVTRHTVGSNPS